MHLLRESLSPAIGPPSPPKSHSEILHNPSKAPTAGNGSTRPGYGCTRRETPGGQAAGPASWLSAPGLARCQDPCPQLPQKRSALDAWLRPPPAESDRNACTGADFQWQLSMRGPRASYRKTAG